MNSTFLVLENSQTETGFKTNFILMKGENYNFLLRCFDLQIGKKAKAS